MPRHALSDADARTCHNCNRFHDKSRQKKKRICHAHTLFRGKVALSVPRRARNGHRRALASRLSLRYRNYLPQLAFTKPSPPGFGAQPGGRRSLHCSACYFTKLAIEAAIVPNEANEVA